MGPRNGIGMVLALVWFGLVWPGLAWGLDDEDGDGDGDHGPWQLGNG